MFELLIGAAGAFGTTAALAGPVYRRLVVERRDWALLGQTFDLGSSFGGLTPSDVLSGTFESYRVRIVRAISQSAQHRGEWCMRYRLDLREALGEGLSLEPRQDARCSGILVNSGDHVFDQGVLMHGPRLLLGGMLDYALRAHLRNLIIERAVAVRKGYLELEVIGRAFSEQSVRESLALLVDLAERLKFSMTRGPASLHSIARNDPHSGVRCRAVELLARYYPSDSDAQAVLREALRDRAPQVRYCAAMRLSEDGAGTLRELVEKGGLLPEYQVRALQRLASLDHEAPVEARLLEMLSLSAAPSVVSSAIEALSRVGSLRAVESLLPLTTLFNNAEVRKRARAAVKRIQGRARHGEAGALSFAAAEELQGALTVESNEGELSLAHREG